MIAKNLVLVTIIFLNRIHIWIVNYIPLETFRELSTYNAIKLDLIELKDIMKPLLSSVLEKEILLEPQYIKEGSITYNQLYKYTKSSVNINQSVSA